MPQWKADIRQWARDLDRYTNSHFLLRDQYKKLSNDRIENLFHRIWFIERRKGQKSEILFGGGDGGSLNYSEHDGGTWDGGSWHGVEVLTIEIVEVVMGHCNTILSTWWIMPIRQPE